MNVFTEIRELVLETLGALQVEGALPEGLAFDNVAVEPPRDAAHGDMATNAAMVLAKPARKETARSLPRRLLPSFGADDATIESAEVAGPGFPEPAPVGRSLADVVLQPALAGWKTSFGTFDYGTRARR